ncbi:MAG: prepilin-type N-terminal cleavage/methylation domain-containing protein [Planctomycetota bacterium]|nr:MAG: prepilin-type N-terminal cleavage/methylation domain-containing protein [Planctomycetota bacterium]
MHVVYFMRSHRLGKQLPKNAFTLIEVLVVVAIIALLISILLPSLSTARGSARMAICATNLRTFGFAMTQYAQENKGFIPRDYQVQNNALLVPDRFSRYLGEPRYPLIPRDQDPAYIAQGEENIQKRDEMLAPIFARMEMLQCPSFPKDRGRNALPLSTDVVIDDQPYDYVVNAFQIERGASYKGGKPEVTKLDKIRNSGKLIYLTEANRALQWAIFRYHDIWHVENLWWSSNSRMIDDNRHNWRTNALFFDSHVESPRIKSVKISMFTPLLDPNDPQHQPP